MARTRLEGGTPRFGARRAGAAVIGLSLLCGTVPAQAQFNFFGLGDASAEDVYRNLQSYGFRPIGPLARNGNVYVADVIDRAHRRERLIISASNAQILQRFYVDVSGGRGGRYGAPLPGTAEAARPASRDENGDGFFSRLARGWSDDAPPRPPASIDTPNDAVVPPVPLRHASRPRSPEPPRIVTRTEDAPITSRPLPSPAPQQTPEPAQAQPASPAVPSAPATVAAPIPVAPAPTAAAPASPPPRTGVTVSTDPLRIPGQREAEPRPAAASTASTAPPSVKPVVAEKKPSPKQAPADVPVAPLE